MGNNQHPIASEALDCLSKGSDEPYAVADMSAAKLRKSLAAEAGSPRLLDAVIELVNLAHFLENQKNSPRAARALLDVAESASDALRALGEQGTATADTVRRASANLNKLIGRIEPQGPKPPGPGDPGAGGVKLRRR